MSQSLSAIYIHAIFGTKFRIPYIEENIELKLHAYMSGILKKLNSPAIKINSMPDHIHVLFRLSKNHNISHVMQVIKKESSKWMKTQGCLEFAWQGGYAAYSVSQSKLEITSNYIVNQKAHHKRKSYLEEVEKFMEEYKVEQYSKDYYWE